MRKKRIQIYADDETLRGVELAARKHNLSVSVYCLTAIRHQLEEDGFDHGEQFAEYNQEQFQELISEIEELQKKILQERGGRPVDVDSILEDLREERDAEALGLR